MDKILEYVKKHFSFLYENYKFKFIDTATSNSFGGEGVLLLSNEIIILKFINDKQQLFLDFQSVYDHKKQWYSIDLIRQLIFPEEKDHSLINKSNIKFLKENLDEILIKFSEPHLKDVLNKLENLKDERADRLFGPIE